MERALVYRWCVRFLDCIAGGYCHQHGDLTDENSLLISRETVDSGDGKR
jgi:hypothetical protein